MKRENVRLRPPDEQRKPQRHPLTKSRCTRPRQRCRPAETGDAVAIVRVADRARKRWSEPREAPRRHGIRGRDDCPLFAAVPANCLDDRIFVPGDFCVHVHADICRRQERESLVQRELIRGPLTFRVSQAKVRAHVELDQIGACGDGSLERRERVLRRPRCGTAMADDERRSAGAPQDHGRRITTIAQSSASSPPEKARQSATRASASSCAPRFAAEPSALSRRSTP